MSVHHAVRSAVIYFNLYNVLFIHCNTSGIFHKQNFAFVKVLLGYEV
jgi:hypothetical protein